MKFNVMQKYAVKDKEMALRSNIASLCSFIVESVEVGQHYVLSFEKRNLSMETLENESGIKSLSGFYSWDGKAISREEAIAIAKEHCYILECNFEVIKPKQVYIDPALVGTMLRLPCRLGTMIYYVYCSEKFRFFRKRKKVYSIMELPFEPNMAVDGSWGNCVFLTKLEAEKRIIELEAKNGK